MFYQNLKFPKVKGRSFFYTNFVSTIDGKVAVDDSAYWPIGSKKDYEVLTELRAYADCLIHGKNLYQKFGDLTKKSLGKQEFQNLRKKLGKNPELPYLLGIHDLKKLVKHLEDKEYKNVLVEGGPTLLGSFLKEELLDEIFLTIAPKIYGSKANSTQTLVEGILLPSNKYKLKLISCKIIKDELFLRYRNV